MAGQYGLEVIAHAIEALGNFLYGLSMPSHWKLVEIERRDHAWHFGWRAHALQATCPTCDTVSLHPAKRYTQHRLRDLPFDAKTVYHTVLASICL